MKRGDRVTVTIEALTPKGDGLTRCDGRDLIVPRTVPGDCVEVYLRRKRRGRFDGVADEYLEHGLPRRDPPCPHFGICGGCRWQDLEYAHQLQLKEQLVQQALAGRGLTPGELHPALPSPQEFYYRNKMEFSFGSSRESGLELGLHMRGRYNRIFDLEACHLQSEVSNRVVDSFRRHCVARELPPYDLRSHEGLLRFLVVRETKQTGQTMVNLVVADYPSGPVDEVMEAVLDEIPEITTALVTLHTGKAQVAIGEEEFVIKGEGHMVERCGPLEYGISPASFFQTNTLQAERLYGLVEILAGPFDGKRVLDLYAGTGGISLQLARRAGTVVAVEQVAEAVADGRRNASRNGLENCELVALPAEVYLSELRPGEGGFQVVVVDPPRAGVHPKALRALAQLAPTTLVYVSCNPETFADDAALLVEEGYELEQVRPVDMFPHTPHCELAARLVRPAS